MELKEYLVEAERTLNYAFNASDIDIQILNHGMIGLVTEVGELVENIVLGTKINEINTSEEMGDISWYVTIFQRRYPRLLTIPLYKNGGHPETTVVKLSVAISHLADDFKRLIYYGKPPKTFKGTFIGHSLLESYEDSIINKMGLIQQLWFELAWQLDLIPEKIYEINIAKLQDKKNGRFKEGKFDPNAVFERDVEAEAKIMNETNKKNEQ